MTRRTGWRIALVLMALAAIAGRLWLARSDEKPAADASTKGAAIAQTHGERSFTLGSLAFAPCELDQRNSAATTAAYCAPFQVPENWDKPDGRKIDLKLAIVRSNAQVAERDLVVLLAGGPGQAATEVYPRAAAGFAPMLRHRNLLLLDQRGTGDSHPLRCAQDPTDFETAAVNEVDFEKVRELTQACLADVVERRRSGAIHDECRGATISKPCARRWVRPSSISSAFRTAHASRSSI